MTTQTQTRNLNPELVDALKRLRLGRIALSLPERLVLADKQDMAFDDLLLMILTDEISRRDNTAADNRAAEARLDPLMRLELWDKSSKVAFDKRLLAELVSLRFLEAHRHAIVLGPVGVGKTFIAQALGHIACRHGYHVRFTRADEMLRTLKQSRFDNSRDAQMSALTSVDLLILDDFALEPMTKEESKDVYQLFLERTGRGSMIISSNRDTSEWLAMFDDVLLAQSAVDRFKNAAYDFVIDGESYRRARSPRSTLPTRPPRARRRKHDCIHALAHDARADVSPTGRGLLGSSPARAGPIPLRKSQTQGCSKTRSRTVDAEPVLRHSRLGCSTRSLAPSPCEQGGPMALRTGTRRIALSHMAAKLFGCLDGPTLHRRPATGQGTVVAGRRRRPPKRDPVLRAPVG